MSLDMTAQITAYPRARTEYEYERLTLPRATSRNAALRLLTDKAEYGHWELATLRMHPDGTRRVVLRRRILRWSAPPAGVPDADR